ncbi:MAG: Flagellar assembly factor FliW [Chlamydiales bacterium]|nr:Flagellar assembly factor FliW [Chlamydiales bacterium]
MPLSRLNRFRRSTFDTWPFKETLVFPLGLLGFEAYTRYDLIGHKGEAPFLRLESKENAAIAFTLMDPFPVVPDYEPLITKRDLQDLSVTGEAKLILLTIVDSLECPSTVNLELPLLIHWHKRRGKQLQFPNNSAHPIDW